MSEQRPASERAGDLHLADVAEARRFEARDDAGELAGYAEYRRGDQRIVFTHTVVEPRFAGRGIATRLIRFALDDARRRGLLVNPICPFVRAFIARHGEYQDLLARPLEQTGPAEPSG